MLRRWIFISVICIVGFFCRTLPAGAQVDTAWVRRYDGPANNGDYCYAIAADSAGCVYVTGCSWGSGTNYDYATIRYYPDGDTAWLRRYNGPENGSDRAYAIAVHGCENVYVAGTSGTMKYTSDGSQVWIDSLFDGRALAVDDSGNVYVTGPSGTRKYGANGDPSWTGVWGGIDIAVGSSQNVYVTGGEVRYETVKYYPDGDTAWRRTYNESPIWDRASGIDVDGAGNVYVTGTTLGSLGNDYATVKYDANGDSLWVRRYDRGGYDDFATGIAADASGNVCVTGYGYNAFWMNTAYVTIKYDTAGNSLWVRQFEVDVGVSKAYAIALDPLDNIYVTGCSNVWGGNDDYASLRYYPNGTTTWKKSYNGPGSDYDAAYAITVGGSGNVCVTGWSWNGTNYDYATIKYVQFLTADFSGSPKSGRKPLSVQFTDLSTACPMSWYRDFGDSNTDTVQNPMYTYDDTGYFDVMLVVSDQQTTDSLVKEDYIHVYELMVGDANGDGQIDVADVMYLINYLFISGSAPDPLWVGDCNCDGAVDVADVMYLVNYLFLGGSPPGC